jgi:predicted permease
LLAGTVAVATATSGTLVELTRSVLIDPLGYPDADRLVVLTTEAGGQRTRATSLPVYMDLRRETEALESVGSMWGWTANYVTDDAPPRQLKVGNTSTSFFETLGVAPAIGRSFDYDEQSGERPSEVILAHAFWVREFGSDPGVVGNAIELSGERFLVIGVLPRWFRLRTPRQSLVDPPYDVWLPLRHNYGAPRENRNRLTVGRLAPSASTEALDAELRVFSQEMRETYPVLARDDFELGWMPMTDALTGSIQGPVLLLLLASLVLLLAGAANVANLTASDLQSRERELIVRRAVGASVRQAVRPALVELSFLTGIGVAVGLWLTFVGVDFAREALPATFPNLDRLSVGAGTMAGTIAVVVVAFLVGASTAVIRLVRRQTIGTQITIRSVSGSAAGPMRVRVAVQVAAAVTILFAAGLLLETMHGLRAIELGFDTEEIVTFEVGLPSNEYPTDTLVIAFYQQLENDLAALPGVWAAGLTLSLPLSGSTASVRLFTDEGQSDWVSVGLNIGSRGLESALGLEVVAGSWFTGTEVPGDVQYIVLDEVTAVQVWGSTDVVGRRFDLWTVVAVHPFDFEVTDAVVLGVVRRARWRSARQDEMGQTWVAHSQVPFDGVAMVLRTHRGLDVIPDARSVVASIDPTVPITNPTSLEAVVDAHFQGTRLAGFLLMLAAFTTVSLALVGVYGIVRNAVGRRLKEVGLRIALGAGRQHVLWLLVVEELRAVAPGVVLGVLGALSVGRMASAALYDVSPASPGLLSLTVVVVVVAALAAGLGPAISALRRWGSNPTGLLT